MPLVFLGAFILWLRFFGFNVGFAMSASKSLGLVVSNTALAGAAGALSAMIGAIASILTVGSIAMWSQFHIDDPTEYLTMNIVGGILGLISVGLFVSPPIL